jgi:hypothetical protein
MYDFCKLTSRRTMFTISYISQNRCWCWKWNEKVMYQCKISILFIKRLSHSIITSIGKVRKDLSNLLQSKLHILFFVIAITDSNAQTVTWYDVEREKKDSYKNRRQTKKCIVLFFQNVDDRVYPTHWHSSNCVDESKSKWGRIKIG